jgi:hypothetical protein
MIIGLLSRLMNSGQWHCSSLSSPLVASLRDRWTIPYVELLPGNIISVEFVHQSSIHPFFKHVATPRGVTASSSAFDLPLKTI